MWLNAPFDPSLTERINRLQAGVMPAPVHPYTCPQAKDGRHAFAAGYLGVLVAQRRGLTCPTCGHTQGWLSQAALAGAERDADMASTQRMEKARQRARDDFARLVREGHTVAQTMVDALDALTDQRPPVRDTAPAANAEALPVVALAA